MTTTDYDATQERGTDSVAVAGERGLVAKAYEDSSGGTEALIATDYRDPYCMYSSFVLKLRGLNKTDALKALEIINTHAEDEKRKILEQITFESEGRISFLRNRLKNRRRRNPNIEWSPRPGEIPKPN